MNEPLVFGWRTALLLVAFTQLILLAGALMRPIRNRAATGRSPRCCLCLPA